MSRRTAEANKAIGDAWRNEQQLVREGKGTRDWTPEQQQDILDKGKAYDEDGKAFQGHHMKSVEAFPAYQGNAGNIQFLSKSEHIAAHHGSFHNPTNGYFDPYTGETRDFGTNGYEPCEIIKLSDPVCISKNNKNAERSRDKSTNEAQTTKQVSNGTSAKEFFRSIGKIVKTAVDTVGEVAVEHPVMAILVGSALKAITDTKKTGDYNLSASEAEKSALFEGSLFDEESFDEQCSDEESFDEDDIPGESFSERLEAVDHTSPREHTVSAHRQRYNGVWKEKKPYTRGKARDD